MHFDVSRQVCRRSISIKTACTATNTNGLCWKTHGIFWSWVGFETQTNFEAEGRCCQKVSTDKFMKAAGSNCLYFHCSKFNLGQATFDFLELNIFKGFDLLQCSQNVSCVNYHANVIIPVPDFFSLFQVIFLSKTGKTLLDRVKMFRFIS